jgi:hypothetical protein
VQAEHVILAVIGLSFGLAGLLLLRIRQVKAEAADVWAARQADGTAPQGVSEEVFQSVWQRVYFPRATLYALALVVTTLVVLPVMAFIVNQVWFAFWNATFATAEAPARVSGSLDTGSLVHGLIGTLLTIAGTVATYIPIMARYQRRRPGRFEAELKRAAETTQPSVFL